MHLSATRRMCVSNCCLVLTHLIVFQLNDKKSASEAVRLRFFSPLAFSHQHCLVLESAVLIGFLKSMAEKAERGFTHS
jgi:hypothetical protein